MSISTLSEHLHVEIVVDVVDLRIEVEIEPLKAAAKVHVRQEVRRQLAPDAERARFESDAPLVEHRRRRVAQSQRRHARQQNRCHSVSHTSTPFPN